MRTLRNAVLIRAILLFMIASLTWLQVGPAWAGTARQNYIDKQNAKLRKEAAQRASGLAPGLTQTPDAALRKKIAAREKAAAKPGADVRSLTAREMNQALGRGPLRNPYFNGTLPWQRSLRDVNLCNGNLFKSFTDVQVAPARGAGLVLQRTYNSNDARVGPFGVGWTHAYDIRIQEAADVQTESGNPTAVSVQPVAGSSLTGGADTINEVPRTDFFGAKHTYHRDADGLYSPPDYMYDEMSSDYNTSLTDGPLKVDDDTDKGMDGTVKHYTSVLTLADGTPGNERACDSITDRYGNTTALVYGQSYVQPDGSTRKLLTRVTDPTGRSLTFQWTNFGTTSEPAYRITEVDAPTDPTTGDPAYRVTYAYYGASDPDAGGAPYQLKSVTLDPDGLNRTTTYKYISYTGSYLDQNGNVQTATETGLLASVIDPLGEVTTYTYASTNNSYSFFTQTIWVTQIVEPAGVDSGGTPRTQTWLINPSSSPDYWQGQPYYRVSITDSPATFFINLYADPQLRKAYFWNETNYPQLYWSTYDNDNNVLQQTDMPISSSAPVTQTDSTYGQHGNVLSSSLTGFSPQETTTYYNASQYFQKATQTDMDGHTTSMGVGTDTAGTPGDPDANPGDRGQVLWVQDAGYNDSASPSYHKQYSYTYNQYGQKISETNLNGVVTTYTYGTSGTDLGNLVQVVQDPGGTGHLNRTTSMHYDVMGRVTQSTAPSGLTTNFTYNSLGQPVTVVTPARGSVAGETLTYTYDGNGRSHSVTDAHRTTTMTYEAGSDRVSSVIDSVTGTTGYTYLPSGERATMSLPGGGTWTYTYADPQQTNSAIYICFVMPKDDVNSISLRLVSVTDDQGRITEYNSLQNGRLLSARSNEVYNGSGTLVSYCEADYSYDLSASQAFTHSWISSLLTSFHWADSYSQWHGRPMSQNVYSYDNAGQRLQNQVTVMTPDASGGPQYTGGSPQYDSHGNATNIVASTHTELYSYDSLNRLKTADYGDGESQAYTFDAMGNRLTKGDTISGTGGGTTSTAYTVDAANRLLTAGSNTYTSDADGNTLTDGTHTNTWDSQNRLVQSVVSGTSASTSAYTYGADGLRRSATVTPSGGSATTTDYAYDGTMLVREMKTVSGTLTPSATYLQGLRGPEYRRDDSAVGTPVRWYVYDGLGSVVGEVDPAGNMTATAKYDVYGAKRSGGTGTATSRQGFVGALGHVSDSETGLVYMRARYYDPQTGRFISQDRSGNGNNWFVYADDNPVNKVDADGKEASDWLDLGMALLSFTLGMMAFCKGCPQFADPGMGLYNASVVVFACLCIYEGANDLGMPSTPNAIAGAVGVIAGMAASVLANEAEVQALGSINTAAAEAAVGAVVYGAVCEAYCLAIDND